MNSNLMTVNDICQWLKVTRVTIERWRKKGLPFIKVGKTVRFNKENVDKWLKDQSGVNCE